MLSSLIIFVRGDVLKQSCTGAELFRFSSLLVLSRNTTQSPFLSRSCRNVWEVSLHLGGLACLSPDSCQKSSEKRWCCGRQCRQRGRHRYPLTNHSWERGRDQQSPQSGDNMTNLCFDGCRLWEARDLPTGLSTRSTPAFLKSSCAGKPHYHQSLSLQGNHLSCKLFETVICIRFSTPQCFWYCLKAKNLLHAPWGWWS